VNTFNNKRKKESCERIKRTFIELIQTKELNEIKVSDICKKAELNRSTFYSNYIDIYDLAYKVKEELFNEVLSLYPNEVSSGIHSYDFLKLLEHIYDNQLFYKTYFKLSYENDCDLIKAMTDHSDFEKFYSDKETVYYHITFFMYGFNAVIRKWLYYGCKEKPEQILEIIKDEYRGKKKIDA